MVLRKENPLIVNSTYFFLFFVSYLDKFQGLIQMKDATTAQTAKIVA